MSALVTLFGNVLQNPQDPRARSDVRLMNLVVNFLSMLGTEEENGGVKRMLGVCSEFERIAKVVLDKSDKESSGRRKRKSYEDSNNSSRAATAAKVSSRQTPTATPSNPAQTPGMVFSPQANAAPSSAPTSQNGYSPMPNGSPATGSSNWVPDFSATEGQEYLSPSSHPIPQFPDFNGQHIGANMSPMNLNAFQQPFVPQDLWQMPMTIEWDWADMTGGAYPSFENGILNQDMPMGNGMGNGLPNDGLPQ